MTDIPHNNDNGDPKVARVLSGRDYRLDFALSEYDVLPDERALLIISGVDTLEAHNKSCVGHLVTLSDNELTWLVGADEAIALRDWQEDVIGIPRGVRVFGWSPPSQPFMAF